jgi:hypothetical protein
MSGEMNRTKLISAMCLFFGSVTLAWCDNFPVTWAVDDTWSVQVEQFTPSEMKDLVSPPVRTVSTKTYLVESAQVTNGSGVFTVKITVSDYTAAFFRARFDAATKTLVSVSTVTLDNGREKEGTPRINDFAPGDTYSYPYRWDDVLFLLDMPRFVVPNRSESPRQIYNVAGRSLVQTVDLDSARTTATVTLVYTETESSLGLVTTQKWAAGEPWPVQSIRTIQSTLPTPSVQIVETLL